ncbi:MAG: signal recognition particle-docking protein FtsY [Eubacteriales bacterium]
MKDEEKKLSIFGKLSQGLAKTRKNLMEKIEETIMTAGIDDDMMEELLEVLISSDISNNTSEKIISLLKDDIRKLGINDKGMILRQIKHIIAKLLDKGESHKLSSKTPLVILMIGVNGAGKTTSIAKIAVHLKKEGKTVLLAAADTFRAAAIEQLEVWGSRSGVNVIKHKEGSDPSAVIFDAISAAKARGIDVLIVDTAGRLQNKKNLMSELEKMYKVIEREYPEAEKETLLVLDACTGKNAISQAKEFSNTTDVTGIVLTKLDGTAKGGIVITIADEFEIPVKYIGVGEGLDDLQEFNPKTFAEALFE